MIQIRLLFTVMVINCGENIKRQAIMTGIEILLCASKEISLQVNIDKFKYAHDTKPASVIL